MWPLSREACPKPFIKLACGQSFIQKTYLRAIGLADVHEVVTVTNRNLFFYTKDEFDEVAKGRVRNTFLLEPFARNSAAAIALAAQYAIAQYGATCTILVLPADHLIDDLSAFANAVKQAVALSATGKLVTFGIKPNAAKTGFGYIEAAGDTVQRFVEKPDQATAREYLSSGRFFWNSGMFCMSAAVFNTELTDLCPDIAKQASVCFKNAAHSHGDGWQQYEVYPDDFEFIQDISIDYAVFEKSKKIMIVPCDIGWSDIGTWLEFGSLHPLDSANNNVSGSVLLEDVKDCIVHGSDRLIAAIGIKNLIIADTTDALLIADKERYQDVS